MLKNSVYLDHHNCTSVCKESAEDMVHFLTKDFCSTTIKNSKGQKSLDKLIQSTTIIKNFFNSEDKTNITFEFNIENIILKIAKSLSSNIEQLHFITPINETTPFINASNTLSSMGCMCSYVQIDQNGSINLDHLKQIICTEKKTSLFSFSSANGITGVVNQVEEISKICKEQNTKTHLDITYSASKMILNGSLFDFLSADFHFINAPKGVFGLVSKEKMKSFMPHHAMIIATAKAVEENKETICWMQTYCSILKKTFEEIISKNYPISSFFGHNTIRLPNCSCIILPKINSELISYHLDEQNIQVTFGGGEIFQNLSQHLKLSLYPHKNIFSAISIAMDKNHSKDNIVYAANTISNLAKKLCEYVN